MHERKGIEANIRFNLRRANEEEPDPADQLDMGNELLVHLGELREKGYKDYSIYDETLEEEPFIFEDKRLRHDFAQRELKVGDKDVHLTETEHILLFHLTKRVERLASYDSFRMINDWRNYDRQDLLRSIKVHVDRLRGKLDREGKGINSGIKSVRGAGWRYVPFGEPKRNSLPLPRR